MTTIHADSPESAIEQLVMLVLQGGIKLSRADVEWLLATHENSRGPVDWSDESQRGREGLDLRGADLHEGDLRNLPLARLHAGPTLDEREQINDEPHNTISVLMERADLREAHLEGAYLCYANLNNASLSRAHLESANLQRSCPFYIKKHRNSYNPTSF